MPGIAVPAIHCTATQPQAHRVDFGPVEVACKSFQFSTYLARRIDPAYAGRVVLVVIAVLPLLFVIFPGQRPRHGSGVSCGVRRLQQPSAFPDRQENAGSVRTSELRLRDGVNEVTPIVLCSPKWRVPRSLSSGAHSRDPLAEPAPRTIQR
jgi:hypothetical protein